MDDDRSTTTLHNHPLPVGSNFQVSNPSEIPLDPDPGLSPVLPPLPAIVTDEKHRRQRQQQRPMMISDARRSICASGGEGPRGGKRKRRSASPPQYTAAAGFCYPAEYYYSNYNYYDEDEEEIETARRVITRPPRIPRTNPQMAMYPQRYLPWSHHPHTNHPREREREQRYYSNYYTRDDPDHDAQAPVNPVVFADIRPLTIRRRTAAAAAAQAQGQNARAARGAQHDPYPYSYSASPKRYVSQQQQPSQERLTRPVHAHAQTRRSLRAAPEWMHRDSSGTHTHNTHSRGGGLGRSSSRPSSTTLNGGVRRGSRSGDVAQQHIRNTSYLGRRQRRRPQIRLAVHGLSYVDEDARSTILGPAERMNEPRIVLGDTGPGAQSSTSMCGGNRAPYARTQSSSYPYPYPRWTEEESSRYAGKHTNTVSQQPRKKPGMRLGGGGGNRNAKRMLVSAGGTRDWSTDLCLFCDHNLGTCCKALWCPCIIYGRNKARIEYLYAEEKVHPTKGGTCSDDCAVHACLTTFCLFGWAIQVPNRASVRRRYNIEGDWLGDCAAALFCSPCELSQESREIDLEERSFEEEQIWDKE